MGHIRTVWIGTIIKKDWPFVLRYRNRDSCFFPVPILNGTEFFFSLLRSTGTVPCIMNRYRYGSGLIARVRSHYFWDILFTYILDDSLTQRVYQI